MLPFLLLILSINITAFAKPRLEISMWTRKAGSYRMTPIDDVQKEKVVTVNLEKQKLVEKELYDAQLEQKYKFRGVDLSTLMDLYKKDGVEDLALLHFDNGIIIPYRYSDVEVYSRLKPFIATAYKETNSKDWKTAFPKLPRMKEREKDPLAIFFDGNKIVVSELWHPSVPPQEKSFNPWRFVSALTEIEFVNKEAYYKQFEVGKSPFKFESGLNVFKARCQYCHGVQMVGANFGWDYVSPIKLYQLRNAKKLYRHVRYEKQDRFFRGIQMPNQESITEKEVDDLWEWLKAVGENNVKSYKPSL